MHEIEYRIWIFLETSSMTEQGNPYRLLYLIDGVVPGKIIVAVESFTEKRLILPVHLSPWSIITSLPNMTFYLEDRNYYPGEDFEFAPPFVISEVDLINLFRIAKDVWSQKLTNVTNVDKFQEIINTIDTCIKSMDFNDNYSIDTERYKVLWDEAKTHFPGHYSIVMKNHLNMHFDDSQS